MARQFIQGDANIIHLHDVVLTPTDDSYEAASPRGCAVEQVVNYQPLGQILVDDDLFSRMDEQNQAALIAHEAYYQLLRRVSNETSSIRVRRAIGYVFNGSNTFTSPVDVIPNKAMVLCTADGSSAGFTDIRFKAAKARGSIRNFDTTLFFIDGALLIGSPITSSFPAGLMTKVLKNDCGKTESSFGWGVPMSGPVEYDRSVLLSPSCHGGKASLNLQLVKPGSSEVKNIELTCKTY